MLADIVYVVPVRVNSDGVHTLLGTNVAYYLLSKPIKITKVGQFNTSWYEDSYIRVRFPVGTYFSSFTYEALVYVNSFGGNNTIMGTEGVMQFRIGDDPGVPYNCLEIAGRQKYNVTKPLESKRWYHVAITYEQPTGKTGIYVNGDKWTGSEWGIDGLIRIRMLVSISVVSTALNGGNVR